MKQHEDRILFLKQFTKELIIQSKSNYPEKEQDKENILFDFMPIQFEAEKSEQAGKIAVPATQQSRYRVKMMAPARFAFHPMKPVQMAQKFIPQARQKPAAYNLEKTGEEINLGNLNFLVSDPRISAIECPGPGKFIMVRTGGKPELTKISLSAEEIQKIIEKFSEKAKIPVISGLFKAAVGNLIITAVISELVGSRFIITKITPLFMLEQQGKRV